MNFSKNLRELRAKNNITQEALAEKIGVSRQMINRYESGENYPEMDKAILLAQSLNCRLDDLVNLRDAATNAPLLSGQNITVKLEKPQLTETDRKIYKRYYLVVSIVTITLIAYLLHAWLGGFQTPEHPYIGGMLTKSILIIWLLLMTITISTICLKYRKR